MFTVSPTSEFARERFKALMEDGHPHSFKEISDYVILQAKEKDFSEDFYSGKVWMAISQLTKKADSEYVRVGHGVYQKGGQAMSESKPSFDWESVLDKAVELQELLLEGASQETPMPDMTPEEAHNYRVISKSTAEGINKVIEGIAAWLAEMEDHNCVQAQENPHGMSMNM